MLLNLTEYSTKTIQDQIYDQILGKIISNEIVAGEEIESIGLLARKQHVSKNTIKKVYQKLQQNNIIEFRNDYGYFVKEIEENKYNEIKAEISRSNIKALGNSDVKNILNEAAEKHKLDEELKLARKIQSDLLPKTPVSTNSLLIHANTQPSRVVCGDFYDYFKIDAENYGLIIADASGKGMPAAILISQIQAIIKSELGNGSTIEKIVTKLNMHLINNCSASSFTSLFYGIVNAITGEFNYVNAGHNFPIILKGDSSFELLKTTGPALGLVPNFEYAVHSVNLEKHSTVLFYTDGITETMNLHGEQYGEGRLIEMLIDSKQLDSKAVIDKILDELEKFKSDKFINDDKTIMLMKYMT